jgi:hypothetical protein
MGKPKHLEVGIRIAKLLYCITLFPPFFSKVVRILALIRIYCGCKINFNVRNYSVALVWDILLFNEQNIPPILKVVARISRIEYF